MTRFILFVLALVPGAIHFLWTGPALWSHNSSSAFDLWLLMWFIAIACPIAILLLPSGEPNAAPSASQKEE